MKRTFCSTFIVSQGEESNVKVEKLIQMFDGLNTKLEHEPFLFHGKHDDHKNPSPSVIEKVSQNFGVKNIFALIADSKLDEVFAGSLSAIAQLTSDLRTELDATVSAFPYTVDIAKFALDMPGVTKAKVRTLWETFLDNLMKERHQIAHGSSQLNGSSVTEIRLSKSKVIILQFALMALLCNAVQT